MSKKILFSLLLLALIISFSCSKNEDIKKLSSTEITNFLLVNEQLPIKTLSNALQWPEDVILGIDLGLIELNEDGEEKLKDIFEDYSEDGKDDFIKDNNKKEWSEFVKGNWIKSETKKITNSKFKEIKSREFKNNEILQNKLNHFIPFYIERQIDELSSYQFDFFSIGLWKNLGQISWMHIRSTTGKISNRDLNYLKSNYIKELQVEWQSKFNLYFSPKTAKKEIGNVLSIYQNLNIIKYKYLSKLNNKKFELNSFTPHIQYNAVNNSKIDVKPIINLFNLTTIAMFDELFEKLFSWLIFFTFVHFALNRITKSEEETRHNILVTFFNTGISPFKVVLGSTALLGNIIVSNKKRGRVRSVESIINRIIGVILIVVFYWFISKKQDETEKEINNNLKTEFSSSFDKSSMQVLDNLNLNTELFFTSI